MCVITGMQNTWTSQLLNLESSTIPTVYTIILSV